MNEVLTVGQLKRYLATFKETDIVMVQSYDSQRYIDGVSKERVVERSHVQHKAVIHITL